MYEIIPGILEKDWAEIEKKLEIIKPFAKSVHIDIIDGKFAPNTTFLDPAPFSKYSQELFLELHMMVHNPTQYLESWAQSGFKRFIGHIEQMPDQAEFIAKAKDFGEVGLAVDGPTPIANIKIPFADLDCVTVMAIKAGQSGQIFNQEYLKKLDLEIPVEIDGGINDRTIFLAKNSGATRFISNSFIFNSENPQEQFNLLKKIIAPA